jgi:hypothetical protein
MADSRSLLLSGPFEPEGRESVTAFRCPFVSVRGAACQRRLLPPKREPIALLDLDFSQTESVPEAGLRG